MSLVLSGKLLDTAGTHPECESWGIYDASDKTFTLQQIHLVGDSIDCCHNLMNVQDKKNYMYMITNNVDEIQMYKDI